MSRRRPEPREMPPMTGAQRRANWWHYHKLHLLIAVLAAAAICFSIWERVNKDAPEGAVDWERMALPWSRCEAVKHVTFMAEDTGGLWFARRMILDEEDRRAFTGAEALWDALF